MPDERSLQRTTWRRASHTEGKHLILKYYLGAWLPILGRRNSRLLFIDGFAGPGEYEGGEPGSPMIALECIRQFKQNSRIRFAKDVEVVCFFIEENRDRANHLKTLLEQRGLPDGTKYFVYQGDFNKEMTGTLDYLDEEGAHLAPAFVMIDPFGVTGFSMQLIERILRNPRSECMISFMYNTVVRFGKIRNRQPRFDLIFGTTRWRRCLAILHHAERKRVLHALFRDQLKSHGAGYVVPFELWDENRHKYTIFFTSGNSKGCDQMKKSMWRTVPTGSYAFRGKAGQIPLLLKPSTEPLARELKEKFGDKATSIETIEEFVMGDETIFHTGHLRQKTLAPLERNRKITVRRPHGGRGFKNGRGITVRFR